MPSVPRQPTRARLAPAAPASRAVPPSATRHTTRRQAAVPAERRNNPMLIYGGAGAALLLLVVILALSAGGKSTAPGSRKNTRPPMASTRPVDVSGHVQAAGKRGDAGLRKGREAASLYERTRGSFSDGDRQRVVGLLQEANEDLEAAMSHLNDAWTLSGGNIRNGIDEKPYVEMRKEVRRMLAELKR